MSTFEGLHPLLQHHVVNSLGWTSLRPFQEQAIGPILAGSHVMLLAPTAGGKTEAASFPVFSRMLTEGWSGLSVLYICPLRALLNNLLPRLQHYAGLMGRRTDIWHGDIGDSVRRRIVSDPPDVLLTTPESLEVMLITRREHHPHLFGQLRCVIVDESHSFAGDDRGWHLLSVVERLTRLAGRPLQRIGLSATVGNPDALLDWLIGAAGGDRTVIAPAGSGDSADLTIDAVGSVSNAATVISRLHRGEKRLVFCDSRSKVEDLATQLRRLEVQTFVSHSSLSLDERRRAEEAFASGSDCVIVATSTLELGIDVGDLDRVIQLEAPIAVSSVLQRLGRTGRRSGTRRNCLFLTTTPESLMQAAALVRLWGTGYVEHVQPPPAPFHILAQQIMALALQHGGIGRRDWTGHIGGVQAFQRMSEDRVRAVVEHMLESEILFDDQGLLWLGRGGEQEYGRRHFMELFTAFVSEPLVSIRHGETHIGSVHPTTFARWPDAEVVLVLGGRSWKVTHVDWRERLAYVVASENQGRSRWAGAGQPIRYELCQAMRDILLGCDLPATISKRAAEKLDELRKDFTWLEGGATAFVRGRDRSLKWWTFGGLNVNASLAAWLKGRRGFGAIPNNLSVRLSGDQSTDEVESAVRELRETPAETLRPEVSDKALQGLKFTACLPEGLATQVMQMRMTDVPGVEAVLRERVRFVTLGGQQ